MLQANAEVEHATTGCINKQGREMDESRLIEEFPMRLYSSEDGGYSCTYECKTPKGATVTSSGCGETIPDAIDSGTDMLKIMLENRDKGIYDEQHDKATELCSK
jgi:hypothetical protein